MMLSKMQPDAGSVRVFTAVFATLVAQVFSEENVPEVTEETVNALLEVPISTGHYIGSFGLGLTIAAIAYVTNFTKYGRKLNPAWKLSPAALLAAFVFFFLDLAREKTALTLPFYLSLFGFPVSLFSGLFTIGVNSGASIFQNDFFAITVPVPIDRKEIDAALKLEGEACVKAFTAFGDDYTFDVTDAKTFVAQVLKATAETTKLSSDEKATIVKALEKLKAKAQELFNADKKDTEFDAIVEILAETKKALCLDDKDDTPYFNKEDFKKTENPKQERNFVKELTDAVQKIDLEKHFNLLVDAWAANKTAKTKFDAEIKALSDALIAKCAVTEFPEASDKAATSLPALRKLIKTLKALDVKKVPSYKDLKVKDKDANTASAFSEELTALEAHLKVVLNEVIKAKVAEAAIADLYIVKETASTYTAATVKDKFVVDFKKVVALIQKEDGVVLDELTEFDATKVKIQAHVDKVIELIKEITTKPKVGTNEAEGKALFATLDGFDTTLYKKADIFQTKLDAMHTAVDPEGALGHNTKKAADEVITLLKDNDKKDKADVLVTALKKGYDEYVKLKNGDDKHDNALEPLMTQLVALRDQVIKVADKAIKASAPAAGETVKELEAKKKVLDELKVSLETADLPTTVFFKKGATDESIFKKQIADIGTALKPLNDAITLAKRVDPTVAATKALKEAKDVDAKCDAIVAGVARLEDENGDKKLDKVRGTLKTELKKVAEAVIAAVQVETKKAKEAVTTVAGLLTIVKMMKSLDKVKAVENKQVGGPDDANKYFAAEIGKLTTLEGEVSDILLKDVPTLKLADAEAAKTKTVPVLLKTVADIFALVPAGENLAGLKDLFATSKLSIACTTLHETVGHAITGVHDLCDTAKNAKNTSSDLLALFSAEEKPTAEYAGVPSAPYDGDADKVLFKDDIVAVVTKASEA